MFNNKKCFLVKIKTLVYYNKKKSFTLNKYIYSYKKKNYILFNYGGKWYKSFFIHQSSTDELYIFSMQI